MKIVVTGHRGYIGSALCRKLRTLGFKPVGFDIQDGAEGDITGEAAQGAITGLAPDLIYNLAGISGEAACKTNPGRARTVNSEAPLEIRKANPKAIFVQASSASVLSRYEFMVTPYAFTKYFAECDLFRAGVPGPLYLLRFATVLGYNHDGPTRWDTPANAMALSARRERKITVNGPELMRPWISLEALTHYLATFASRPPRNGWDGPIPLAQENLSLGDMAKWIGLQRPGCEKVINPAGVDARDYTMPALIGNDLSWAIKALVEHA